MHVGLPQIIHTLTTILVLLLEHVLLYYLLSNSSIFITHLNQGVRLSFFFILYAYYIKSISHNTKYLTKPHNTTNIVFLGGPRFNTPITRHDKALTAKRSIAIWTNEPILNLFVFCYECAMATLNLVCLLPLLLHKVKNLFIIYCQKIYNLNLNKQSQYLWSYNFMKNCILCVFIIYSS